MSTYNLIYDTGNLKRADEAIKKSFVETNARLKELGLPEFNSIESFLVDQVINYVTNLVKAQFDQPRLNRILTAMPTWTEQEILDVAAAGHVDLTIDVPK